VIAGKIWNRRKFKRLSERIYFLPLAATAEPVPAQCRKGRQQARGLVRVELSKKLELMGSDNNECKA
ncbi:MAG TPA: hypothetical protein PL012_11380, partial [Candidatus Obscuribacter sp.]|nr:hypothetical protein [Candidatus Obscuribacter sp.]